MTRIEPAEAISALRPLLQNTPRLPIGPNTPAEIRTPDDVRLYLDDVAERTQWAICPSCANEWNALTHTGKCIACVDQETENDVRQVKLGEYLRKTIGIYGVERYSYSLWDKTPENAYAYERFQGFDWQKDNLFLYGGCGTGKTHLAGALLKDVCAKSLNVKWINPLYVSRGISRARFNMDEESFVDALVANEVLIIDDLGVGKDTDATLRLIYEITDKRSSRKQNGLVITSNLSLDELAKNYRDDRIASRISGMCDVINIQGRDRRLNH